MQKAGEKVGERPSFPLDLQWDGRAIDSQTAGWETRRGWLGVRIKVMD
jgi:hypothetical protein